MIRMQRFVVVLLYLTAAVCLKSLSRIDPSAPLSAASNQSFVIVTVRLLRFSVRLQGIGQSSCTVSSLGSG